MDVIESPIAKCLVKSLNEDRAGLRLKINTAHYLLKYEWHYTDYPKFLQLQKENNVSELLKKRTESAYTTSDAGATFVDFIGN